MKGTVRAKGFIGGGFNEYGEPIPTTIEWGNPVECSYYANTLNNRGRYSGGVFTQSEYTITTEDMDFDAKQIRLTDSRGKVVCEKVVQSIEVLEDVQRVKITV